MISKSKKSKYPKMSNSIKQPKNAPLPAREPD